MRRRYFVRCLAPIGIHREGHEICLEADEFAAVRGKGVVSVQFEEHDGKRVDVEGDAGAVAVPPPALRAGGLLEAPTDEEWKIIIDRRARTEAKKADDEAKAKAEAEKQAKAAAKKADEEAKAKASDKN